MFKRIASSGINLLVLVISIAVFACAFLGMITLSKAQRPATINVLAAGRDLNIGETITQADITEKSVYKDENTALYIPAEQITDVTGGIVALPIAQGQPIMRNAILPAKAPACLRYLPVISRRTASFSHYCWTRKKSSPRTSPPFCRAI